VVRSDSKIDEDWKRKLRERKIKEYGERNEDKEEKKKKKKKRAGKDSVFF